MISLGMDLGENLAWVRGGAVGPITWGTFAIPTETRRLGRWLRATDNTFREIMPGVEQIGAEQPFMGKDIYAARKLFGQYAMACYWAEWLAPSAPMRPVMIQTGKYTLTGIHNATGEQMVEAAAAEGFEMNVHEAHALGVWKAITFGARNPPPPARTRSSKGESVKP